MGTRQIAQILDNKVVKVGQSFLMSIETEKTRRAYEIGESSGLFRVPRVLTFDPTAGRLELELLTSIRPLRLVLRDCSDWKNLMARIGRSLAVIHNQLCLPPALAVPLSEAWQLANAERVVLHGDFGISNVQVDERDGHLVILDWSVMPMLGTKGTVGPREFDVAWFIRDLFFVRRRWGFLSNRTSQEADIFLENYFAQTDYSRGTDEFLRYLRDIEGLFLQTWRSSFSVTYLRRIDYVLHAGRYKRYVRGSKLQRKCKSVFQEIKTKKKPNK
jgi:hypothetical protein